MIPFSWAFQPFFFFSQAPSTSSTNHKHKHKPMPIRNPPNQTIKPTKPPIRNPRRRFETHRSKPIQKKSSSEQPQPQPNHDHDLTMTNDQRPTSAADPRPTTPFSCRSTTNNPLHPSPLIHDQRPTSSQLADPQPRPKHWTRQQPTTHNHAKNHNHY